MKGFSSVHSRGTGYFFLNTSFPTCPSPVVSGNGIRLKSDLSLCFFCLQKEVVICLANGMFLLHLERRRES